MTLETLLQFFPESLRALITATDVSDVMINADGRVYVDRAGKLVTVPVDGISPTELLAGVQTIARILARDLDDKQPILNTRLPDGSRVAAVLLDGELTLTIRKFNQWYDTGELALMGCAPGYVLSEAVEAVRRSRNILVSGGTGSGKTTLAKALLDHVPGTERLIIIENPREMAVSQPNAVRLEAREEAPGRPAVTVAQLLIAALRHRPDRIVIGEVREPSAAYELLRALNTGHAGSISTIHADSALDALYRLSDLALTSHGNLETSFVRKQVARAIHYVVHIERGSDGNRRVTELLRVKGYGAIAEFEVEKIYENEEELCLS